jgi:branched-subunit amino acid transport protein
VSGGDAGQVSAAVLPLLAVLASALVTYLPRALGVMAGRRIDTDSRLFRWFGCVAYAMLAGLVTRMILLPIGPLQATTLSLRLSAVAVAVLVFLVARRNLPVGLLAGLVTLALLIQLQT